MAELLILLLWLPGAGMIGVCHHARLGICIQGTLVTSTLVVWRRLPDIRAQICFVHKCISCTGWLAHHWALSNQLVDEKVNPIL